MSSPDAGAGTEAQRPAELADVQGAWRRDGRSLDGGAPAEVSDVLWLQAGTLFCDLRSALPGASVSQMLDLPQAFAGRVEVAGGSIAFHHDLDTLERDPQHPDVSTVHRAGEVLWERGPGFEERWVLASLPDDPTGVAEWRPDGAGDPRARVVRVGALALAVWGGPDPGGAQYGGRLAWEPERAGSCPPAARIDEAVQALVFGDPLPAGWAVPDGSA